MAKKRMMPAINMALEEEMSRNSKVILYGEDAGISLLGQTTGLQEKFGKDRVRDTPICEWQLVPQQQDIDQSVIFYMGTLFIQVLIQ
jgi:pyruvate/2-oxoglutarate/acetoin dehydrogenase E1 component